MPQLIALSYSDETIARQAADELLRHSDHLPFDPDALAVIVCERDGRLQLVTSRHPGTTASWGRFWGVLFEALTNETDPTGLDPDFRQRLAGLMMPGSSVLLAVAGRSKGARVQAALSQFNGTFSSCSLSNDRMPELWVSLGGSHSRV